jgi:drug/metabolite transporter (DMT)-like permease
MGAPAASADHVGASAGSPGGLVYAALIGQVALSAGTYLAGKRAMGELSPFTVVLWRFVLCAITYGAILAVTKGPKLPPRSALPQILLLGFLVGPLNQILFFYGLSRSTPAHSALLYALTPIGVYGVSLVRGQERARRKATLGIALALAGVLVLLLGRGTAALHGMFLGDLFILAAVCAWVFYTAEGKQVVSAHGPVRAIAWSMITGAVLVLPIAPAYLRPVEVWHASVTARACILYLALMTSVVSYSLWYFALSRTVPSKVAIFTNLNPVATAIAAWLLLGDPIGWPIVAGGALVIAGVRLTQR